MSSQNNTNPKIQYDAFISYDNNTGGNFTSSSLVDYVNSPVLFTFEGTGQKLGGKTMCARIKKYRVGPAFSLNSAANTATSLFNRFTFSTAVAPRNYNIIANVAPNTAYASLTDVQSYTNLPWTGKFLYPHQWEVYGGSNGNSATGVETQSQWTWDMHEFDTEFLWPFENFYIHGFWRGEGCSGSAFNATTIGLRGDIIYDYVALAPQEYLTVRESMQRFASPANYANLYIYAGSSTFGGQQGPQGFGPIGP